MHNTLIIEHVTARLSPSLFLSLAPFSRRSPRSNRSKIRSYAPARYRETANCPSPLSIDTISEYVRWRRISLVERSILFLRCDRDNDAVPRLWARLVSGRYHIPRPLLLTFAKGLIIYHGFINICKGSKSHKSHKSQSQISHCESHAL